MLDTVFRILKITVIIFISSAFMVAINAILSLITSVIFTGVIGDVLVIVSACLPFNALAVFGAMGTATYGYMYCTAILLPS